MVTKFPEMYERAEHAQLKLGKVPFAIYKTEKDSGRRSVFLTEHMLIFLIKGRKQLHFPGKIVDIDSNSVILLKRGIYMLSEYVAEMNEYESLAIFIPDNFVKRFIDSIKNTEHTKGEGRDYVVIPSNKLLDSYKHQYKSYFGQEPAGLADILNVKLQELLLLLVASAKKSEVLDFLYSIKAAGPADLDYIMKQYLLQPIALDELARISSRSLATFKRDFKKRYNCAPRQWITRERLKHADVLLNNTGKSVAEISYSCGFENVSHFIKLYKKYSGYTPNASRAESVMI